METSKRRDFVDDATFSKPKKVHSADHGTARNTEDFASNDIATGMGRWRRLDAYQKHKLLVNQYLLTNPGSVAVVFERNASNDVHDLDIVKRHYRFLMENDTDAADKSHASNEKLDSEHNGELLLWEKKVALKYYKRLHQEYCIIDLTLYKTNNVGMRWRTEREVIDGKGHFTCGSRKCTVRSSADVGLQSWEVNFAYTEKNDAGDLVKKNALVKVRLCEECSAKLNHNKQHRRFLPQNVQSPASYKSSIAHDNQIDDESGASSTKVVERFENVTHFPSRPGVLSDTGSPLKMDFRKDSSVWKESGTEGEHAVEPRNNVETDNLPNSGVESAELSREQLMDSYLDDLFL